MNRGRATLLSANILAAAVVVVAVVAAVVVAGAVGLACSSASERTPPADKDDGARLPPPAFDVESARVARAEMVEHLRSVRGITDARVLKGMGQVPRHEFVPMASRADAYVDRPISIGEHQTISQPYIVALMTSLAELGPTARVLEVGTGSGYTSAVLSQVAAEVYTIEIRKALAERARAALKRLGYDVNLRAGDGYKGWPEAAPFDAIIVTAAPATVPEPLKEQLKVGGRLVIPVGSKSQELVVIVRTESGFETKTVSSVVFTPMVHGKKDGGL